MCDFQNASQSKSLISVDWLIPSHSIVTEVRLPGATRVNRRSSEPIGLRPSRRPGPTFLFKLTLLDVPVALARERDLGEIELFLKDQEGVGANTLLIA